jgi:hypothetical protein
VCAPDEALGVRPRLCELSKLTIGGDFKDLRFVEGLLVELIYGWKTRTLAQLARSSWPLASQKSGTPKLARNWEPLTQKLGPHARNLS